MASEEPELEGASAPGYDGEWFGVEVRGTYTKPSPSEATRIPKPTIVRAIKGAPIVQGLYIGLQGVGMYKDGPPYPPRERLGAVFLTKYFDKPNPTWRGGVEKPFVSVPTVEGVPTDIPEDFEVPFDRRVIVRAPYWASGLAFSVGDSWYSDNSALPGFGVHLSLPNGTAYIDTDLTGPPALDPALKHTPTPFGIHGAHIIWSQWRGWYRVGSSNKSVWRPDFSGWNGPRPSGAHTGWDIFCPSGTRLVAPLDSDFLWHVVPGYGNVAQFSFTLNGARKSLFYAHCGDLLHKTPAKVKLGTPVATSGCSGNAGGELCGFDYPSGGRTDHVHVGLVSGEIIKPELVEDPATVLRWMIA